MFKRKVYEELLTWKNESIDQFENKYSSQVGDRYLLSQKDVGHKGTLIFKPLYMALFLLRSIE